MTIYVGAWTIPAGVTSKVTTLGGYKDLQGSTGVITDVGGLRDLVFNNCDHTVNKVENCTNTAYNHDWQRVTIASGPSAGKPCDIRVNGTMNPVGAQYEYGTDVQSYLNVSSVAALKLQAEGQMKPGAPPQGFDLAQFIGELTDFSSLFKSIARGLLNAKDDLLDRTAHLLSRRIYRAAFTVEQKPWSEIAAIVFKHLLNVGVSSHLAWKLVYEPLYRDLGKLKDALLRYDDRLRRLQLPKTFRVYGTAISQGSALADSGPIGLSYGYNGVQTRKVVTWALVRQKPLFNVVPSKFLRAYYGLSPRLSVAWELMPLSFVVDWFMDIGAWLRQFDGSVYQIPFELISSGYSVKDEWSVQWIARPTYQWANAFVGVTFKPVMGKRFKSVYQRRAGGITFNPAGAMQPLELKLPNLGQLGTLAELVYVGLRGK